MNRHFLIAVSDQKSSFHGLKFVADFFADKTQINPTLFYCAPKPPQVWEDEKSLGANIKQKEQEGKIMVKGRQILAGARKACLEKGFIADNITEKIQQQVLSKVADIIQEGEKGSYDAVVLGRRGLTILEEAFEDSISRKLYNEKIVFPLWLCRSSDPARKGILLYVDGSAASFRMADHVGFVLSTETRHTIDILAQKAIIEDPSLMDQYQQTLVKGGLSEDRIQFLKPGSGNPAKQVMEAVEKKNYAAVALGRSTSESGLLSRLFKGPVCSSLFKDLETAALWVCP